MAQYNLLGEEGTIWQGSREVDPSCILPTGARAKTVATSDEKVDDSAAGKNVYSSVYFVMMAMLISIFPHQTGNTLSTKDDENGIGGIELMLAGGTSGMIVKEDDFY